MGLAGLMPQHIKFHRPTDVLSSSSLTIDDKRAILARWPSDRYAIQSQPIIRLSRLLRFSRRWWSLIGDTEFKGGCATSMSGSLLTEAAAVSEAQLSYRECNAR